MNNKLFILICFFVLSIISTSAQNANPAKTSFAIIGGVNFQNFNGKNIDGDQLDNKLIVGFNGGFNVMIPIVQDFYFQPGLLFSTKGSKSKNDSFSTKYKLSYIEMPLNFVYKALVGKGYFMLGFGPYVGYGIKGKTITENSRETITGEIKFKNSVETTDPNNVPYMKAFDAGANIFAGYEFANGIFVQLNTQLGMVKINSEYKMRTNDQTVTKNTGFGLSVGYRF